MWLFAIGIAITPGDQIHDGHRYQIVNALAGTAIDLSGEDKTTITGWQLHDGENQKWLLVSSDGHWHIRNVLTGRYLAPRAESYDDIRDGTHLIGSERPFSWDIKDEHEDSYRIYVPGFHRPINVDLDQGGNPSNGTKVIVWGKVDGDNGGKNQRWRFERV